MLDAEFIAPPINFDEVQGILDRIKKRLVYFQIGDESIEEVSVKASRIRTFTAWLALNPDSFTNDLKVNWPNFSPDDLAGSPVEFNNFWHNIELVFQTKAFPTDTAQYFNMLENAAYAAENESCWSYVREIKNELSTIEQAINDKFQRICTANDYQWGLLTSKVGAELELILRTTPIKRFSFLTLNFSARSGMSLSGTLSPEAFYLKGQIEVDAMLSALQWLKHEIRTAYRKNIPWTELNAVQRNLHNWYFEEGYAKSSRVSPDWNERQLSIIKLLFSRRTITTRELYGFFDCNRKTIQRDFKELIEEGIVAQERQGSALRYALQLREAIELSAEAYNITLSETNNMAVPEIIKEMPRLHYKPKLSARAAKNLLQLSFDYSSSSLNR